MSVQAVLICILFATLRTDNVSVLVLEVNSIDMLLQGPLMKIWRGNMSSLKCLLSSYESNSSLTFLTVRALFPAVPLVLARGVGAAVRGDAGG